MKNIKKEDGTIIEISEEKAGISIESVAAGSQTKERLFKSDNVVAMYSGNWKNDKKTDDVVETIYVKTKKSPSKVLKREMVPKTIAGKRTDVVAVGDIVAESFGRDEFGRFDSSPRIIPDLEASDEIGYLMGVWKGDGCLQKVERNGRNHFLKLNTVDPVFANEFAKTGEQIGLHPAVWTQKPHKNCYTKKLFVPDVQCWRFYKKLEERIFFNNFKENIQKEIRLLEY